MYCSPAKLYFGEDSLTGLNEGLPKYGQNVQLVYGGGSIKENCKKASEGKRIFGSKSLEKCKDNFFRDEYGNTFHIIQEKGT